MTAKKTPKKAAAKPAVKKPTKAEKDAARAESLKNALAAQETMKAKAAAETAKKLDPLAKEINARFEKADKLDAQSSDHRLAAALQLAEAQKICDNSGTDFKAWAEEHVKQAYDTVRRLAIVGASPDPKLALTDMRAKNAQANKAARERKRAEERPAPRKQPQAAIAGPSVAEAIEAMKPEDQLALVKTRATELGMAVVSQTEAERLSAPIAPFMPEAVPYATVVDGFNNLKPSEKMKFVRYAADQCGLKVVDEFAVAEGEEPEELLSNGDDALEIPPFLKRNKAA